MHRYRSRRDFLGNVLIDTWLITNGYNVGIVQLVGQAINKVKLTKLNRHITAIGLCKWGSIKDVEVLTSSQSTGKQVIRR